MKKHLLIFIVFLLIQKTQSQIIFCPPGAEWHYLFKADLGSALFNEQIKYTGDSTFNGETVKLLKHGKYFKWQNFGGYKLTMIKQKGDTVFFRSTATQDTWQILYNFAAQPGQGWVNNISTFKPYSGANPPTPIVTYTVSVDSVNNIIQNGFTLKRLYVKYKFYPPWVTISNPYVESVTIDERIGASKFFFNFYNIRYVTDNDYFFANLCYSDSVFGVKQFTEMACNIEGDVGINEGIYQNQNIRIYPNPANDIFTISTNHELKRGNYFVSITDLFGRKIKQVELRNSSLVATNINIAELESGIYILNISNNNEVVYTGKLVKSE